MKPAARIDFPLPSHVVLDDGTIELRIPGYLPPGMNEMLKMHWAELQRTKRDWGILILKALGRERPSFPRARIHTIFYRVQLMDKDNNESCFKCIGDALQNIEVIPNDNTRAIESTVEQLRVMHRPDVGTEIRIRKIDEVK